MTRLSLRPGPRSGLEIAEARAWRINASSGGGVVLQSPDSPDIVIASPGEVARVVVLRGEQVPKRLRYHPGFDEVLVVLSDDAALLVVPLHLLSHGRITDATELRRVSGAADFAQALGLTLEPADAREVELAAAADSATILGPVRESLRRVTRRHIALLATAVAALIATISLSDVASLIAGSIGTLAVAILAVDDWRFRSRFMDLVENPPSSPDRVDVPNVRGGDARLQIGPDDVVHVAGGSETWIAGPRLGGAVQCLAGQDTVRFVDRHGSELLVLDAAVWIGAGDDAALRDACRRAGIEHRSVRDTYSAKSYYTPVMSQAALGDFIIAGPLATCVLAIVFAMGHLFPVEDRDAARIVVAVVAALAAALSATAQFRLWRWERRQRQAGGS